MHKTTGTAHYFISAFGRLCILCLFLPALSHAFEPTIASTIVIEADSAMFDRTQHISTYSGNVSIQSNATHIIAEAITLTGSITQDIETVTAVGIPVRFSHTEYDTHVHVHGSAERMLYDAVRSTVDLYGNAVVVRGEETYRGGHIAYDIDSGSIRAEGATQRVRITLPSNR